MSSSSYSVNFCTEIRQSEFALRSLFFSFFFSHSQFSQSSIFFFYQFFIHFLFLSIRKWKLRMTFIFPFRFFVRLSRKEDLTDIGQGIFVGLSVSWLVGQSFHRNCRPIVVCLSSVFPFVRLSISFCLSLSIFPIDCCSVCLWIMHASDCLSVGLSIGQRVGLSTNWSVFWIIDGVVDWLVGRSVRRRIKRVNRRLEGNKVCLKNWSVGPLVGKSDTDNPSFK